MRYLLILIFLSVGLFASGQIEKRFVMDGDNVTSTSLSSIGVYQVGKVRYYTPDNSVDTMKFTSVQPATLDQVSITFQTLAATDTVYLDWGNGSAVVKISKVTDQTVTSSYAINNTTYNIKLYGDLSKVKKFYVSEATVASLNMNDISDYMVNLEYLYLRSITATGNKALPTGITYLYLYGDKINWTGLDIGNNGNITELSLLNYRVEKMSSEDMVTLLTQMTNRDGSFPATITINDYADYALQPQAVTDAVAALRTAKSITTVTLGK
jgi:hypothetical protein